MPQHSTDLKKSLAELFGRITNFYMVRATKLASLQEELTKNLEAEKTNYGLIELFQARITELEKQPVSDIREATLKIFNDNVFLFKESLKTSVSEREIIIYNILNLSIKIEEEPLPVNKVEEEDLLPLLTYTKDPSEEVLFTGEE